MTEIGKVDEYLYYREGKSGCADEVQPLFSDRKNVSGAWFVDIRA